MDRQFVSGPLPSSSVPGPVAVAALWRVDAAHHLLLPVPGVGQVVFRRGSGSASQSAVKGGYLDAEGAIRRHYMGQRPKFHGGISHAVSRPTTAWERSSW